MKFNLSQVSSHLQTIKGGGDNSCPPSQVAINFFNAIPDSMRVLFKAPRGVCNNEGQYVGSIVQLASGAMRRLHGPAFEVLTAHLLQVIGEMSEEEEVGSIDKIIVDGEEVVWDVRRYANSQNRKTKQWSNIPDLSYYFDCTASDIRDALRKEEDSDDEEESQEKASAPVQM